MPVENRNRKTRTRYSVDFASMFNVRDSGKSAISIHSCITAEVRSTRAAMLKGEKGGTRSADPPWRWQYKAWRVAGLSQSVSGTYTFKVRVLEGEHVPVRPPRTEVDDHLSTSRSRDISRISLAATGPRSSGPDLYLLPPYPGNRHAASPLHRASPFIPPWPAASGERQSSGSDWGVKSWVIPWKQIVTRRRRRRREKVTFPVEDEYEVLAGAALGSSFCPCRWVSDFSASFDSSFTTFSLSHTLRFTFICVWICVCVCVCEYQILVQWWYVRVR